MAAPPREPRRFPRGRGADSCCNNYLPRDTYAPVDLKLSNLQLRCTRRTNIKPTSYRRQWKKP